METRELSYSNNQFSRQEKKIWEQIFISLSQKDRVSIDLVCREWHKILRSTVPTFYRNFKPECFKITTLRFLIRKQKKQDISCPLIVFPSIEQRLPAIMQKYLGKSVVPKFKVEIFKSIIVNAPEEM